jgi:hypothetical protein
MHILYRNFKFSRLKTNFLKFCRKLKFSCLFWKPLRHNLLHLLRMFHPRNRLHQLHMWKPPLLGFPRPLLMHRPNHPRPSHKRHTHPLRDYWKQHHKQVLLLQHQQYLHKSLLSTEKTVLDYKSYFAKYDVFFICEL